MGIIAAVKAQYNVDDRLGEVEVPFVDHSHDAAPGRLPESGYCRLPAPATADSKFATHHGAGH